MQFVVGIAVDDDGNVDRRERTRDRRRCQDDLVEQAVRIRVPAARQFP